jgi:hypothetical protein
MCIIGFIQLVYPNATIIHTMRDPMDTLYSCFKHKFDDTGLEWSMDPEELALQYYLCECSGQHQCNRCLFIIINPSFCRSAEHVPFPHGTSWENNRHPVRETRGRTDENHAASHRPPWKWHSLGGSHSGLPQLQTHCSHAFAITYVFASLKKLMCVHYHVLSKCVCIIMCCQNVCALSCAV